MGDAMARAVGAGSPMTIEIGGKQCTVRPLSIRELAEVERDCVQRYRRSYLKTFTENADLIPERLREGMVQEKFELAARWDVDDLPLKYAFDAKRIEVSDELKSWIVEEYGTDPEAPEKTFQGMAASALDQGMLSEDRYEQFTRKKPKKSRVPYVSWWITGSTEGMITFLWLTFKHDGVTREQVVKAMESNPTMLVEVAREIERLSSPQLGNG